jgi:hypothetical protein
VRVILKLILRKQNVRTWTGFSWFRRGFGGGILRNKTVTSVSVKGGKFADQPSDYVHLEDFAHEISYNKDT